MPKMPKMCYRYSQDVLKTCQGDAQDFPIMLKICPRYCRISKRSPTDSLTGPPIWKRCLRNAHPKMYFCILLKWWKFYCEKIHFRKATLSLKSNECSGMLIAQCPFLSFFSVLDSGWKKMISRFLQRSPSITLWDGAGMVIVVKHRNGRKKERSNFIGFQCRNSRDNASPRLSRWSSSEMKLHLFATTLWWPRRLVWSTPHKAFT